jgi:hypothetical protein
MTKKKFKRLCIGMSCEEYHALRVEAAESDISMSELVRGLIAPHVKKRGSAKNLTSASQKRS